MIDFEKCQKISQNVIFSDPDFFFYISGWLPSSFNFSKMLTDESEDIDDTEGGLSSEFVDNVKFLTQKQHFDAQAAPTWERRCGQKSNAPELEAGRKPST